jgi:hypothetical protein
MRIYNPGRIGSLVFVLFVVTIARADPIQDAEIAEAENCNNTGLCGNKQAPVAPHASVDPCFIAQNAMRPCTAAPRQPSKPIGVDPNTVGTWELAMQGGPWVWQIRRNGTYSFHSEAGDGAPPHAGAFSASNGQWSLQATNGYADSGTYLFQRPDTLIATGKLGTAAWRRPAPNPAANKPAPPPAGSRK